jgi:transcription antitermination factor NusG
LEKKFYVNKVMSSKPHGMRVLNVISNDEVMEMKRQLQKLTSSDIEEGTQVRVTEGSFNAFEGEVVYANKEEAFVKFELRTLHLIAKIPKVFLEAVF